MRAAVLGDFPIPSRRTAGDFFNFLGEMLTNLGALFSTTAFFEKCMNQT